MMMISYETPVVETIDLRFYKFISSDPINLTYVNHRMRSW
jgi:hypothetical protein